MLVELDLFSGRPNPRWELDEPASRHLRRLEGGLESTTAPPPEPPGLGYRGFLYFKRYGSSRAFGRTVRTPSAVLSDPTSSIERFLLEQLPPELVSLRAVVARELEASDGA